MRLTCPNCGAEYEVPDEVIPSVGRDVQCSNCGDTWYQYHPDNMPEPDDLPDADPDLTADPAAETEDWPEDAAPVDADEDQDEDDSGDRDDAEDDDVSPQSERPSLRRRPLSPEVKSILREEAQLEERTRVADPLESQPDLGLSEPAPPPPPRRESVADSRLARVREKPEARAEPPSVPDDAIPSRRNLLPDIEEINSSLRRKGETIRTEDARSGRKAAPRKKRGFRGSFLLIVLLLVLATVVYVQAPRIVEAFPQVADPMQSYVDAVDQGRVWLDKQAATLAEKLDELAQEAPAVPSADPTANPSVLPATPSTTDGAATTTGN